MSNTLKNYVSLELNISPEDLNDDDIFNLQINRLKKKYKDYIGLSFNVENSYLIKRIIIRFDASIIKNIVYSINNIPIDCESSSINSMKIVDIKPIKKSELTDKELYDFFNYTSNVFDDTKEFQEYYGLMDDTKNIPYFIEDEKLNVKIGHLHEELEEIEKAVKNKDLSEFADAIIDLIYVAAGLGALCKLPMHALWNDVQNSNMVGKERVTSLDNATKRKSTFDVRKTAEWVGPRGKDIIKIESEK